MRKRRPRQALAVERAAFPRVANSFGLLALTDTGSPRLRDALVLFDGHATEACVHVGRRAIRKRLFGLLSGALPVWCSDCNPDVLAKGLVDPERFALCGFCDVDPRVVTVAQCVAVSPRGVYVNLRLCAQCVADICGKESE